MMASAAQKNDNLTKTLQEINFYKIAQQREGKETSNNQISAEHIDFLLFCKRSTANRFEGLLNLGKTQGSMLCLKTKKGKLAKNIYSRFHVYFSGVW